MRARVFLLCGLLAFATGATPRPAPTPRPQTLRAFVVLMLDRAPVDYSNMRGARKDGAVYRTRYKTLPQFVATCHSCTITDEFAWAAHAENWSLEQRWNAPKMTSPQVQSYLAAQLTPAPASPWARQRPLRPPPAMRTWSDFMRLIIAYTLPLRLQFAP